MARKELNKITKDRGSYFAKRLKEERQKLEYSQSDLSRISNVPLDTLRSIENGRITSPGLFIAADLVHALKGNLDGWLEIQKKRKSK